MVSFPLNPSSIFTWLFLLPLKRILMNDFLCLPIVTVLFLSLDIKTIDEKNSD
jgi:hypothetical protein